MNKLISILVILALFLTGCGDSFSNPNYSQISSNNSTVNSTMYGIIEGDGLHIPTVDKTTGALITIDQLHNEVHQGDMKSWCNVTTLSSGANLTLLFITPNSSVGIVNFEFDIQSTGETGFQIFEASNVSGNGQNQSSMIIARNRNFTDFQYTQIYSSPNITSNGLMICDKHWGAGRSTGGENVAANEFDLKPSTNYIIEITSFANSNTVSTEMWWYRQIPLY